MPKNTALNTHYRRLNRSEKLQFLLDFNYMNAQIYMEDEKREEFEEITKDYFVPKDEKGQLVVSETSARLGELLKKKSELEEQFGREVQKIMAQMPNDEKGKKIPENEREAAAIFKASRETLAGYRLSLVNRFIEKDLFEKGYITDADCNAFLKSQGITVKTARNKENVEAAQKENRQAFLNKMNDVYRGVKVIHEQALTVKKDDAGKAAYEIGHKFPTDLMVAESSLSAEAKAFAINREATSDAEFYKREIATKLEEDMNYAELEGRTSNLLYQTAYPKAMSKVHGILRSTGAGDAWWHKNNSEDFDDVLKYMKAYDEVAASGASLEEINEAGQSIVTKGLAYIDGKEKVRSSQFGRDRFDAVMTALSLYMDRADFEALCNKINKKRGVLGKRSHEDYVSVDKYVSKASQYSRRIPFDQDLDQEMLRQDQEVNPIPRTGEFYELNNIKGIGDRNVDKREFAAIAFGIKGQNPVQETYKALYANTFGEGKETLAKVIVRALRQYNREANGSNEITDKWALNAERTATLLEWLEKDPELAKAAQELGKGDKKNEMKGLTEDEIVFAKGQVETAKLAVLAKNAEKRLNSNEKLTDEQKRSLYTDIVKFEYVNAYFYSNHAVNDANSPHYKDFMDGEEAFKHANNKEALQTMLRGEKRELSKDIIKMSNPDFRKALDAGCKNALNTLKPEKYDFNEAKGKIKGWDFQKKTLTNAVTAELEKPALKSGPVVGKS